MSAYGDLAAPKPTGLSTLLRQMEAEHADEAAQAHVEGRNWFKTPSQIAKLQAAVDAFAYAYAPKPNAPEIVTKTFPWREIDLP